MRLAGALAIVVFAGCESRAPVAPPPTAAALAPPSDAGIDRWIAGFHDEARAAGIDEATWHTAFDPVQYLPRVVDADRSQPEFTLTVWDYLDRAVGPERVALGRSRLAQHREAADAAAARFGVPAEVLVAIWGIESNFGSNYGDIPTIDALATLGFEGRRQAWARKELLAALKILQRGDIDRAHMVGSWAGAMGQTQFLPSVFLAYGIDADQDGRCDIWGSLADVMASTANFVAASGWRAGEPWGIEVRLPPGFDVARADDGLQQATAQWVLEGVQSMDGAPLPPLTAASIFLPAGARGPAFLLGPNFRALLRYNASSSYALAVGLLAQALAGGPQVLAPWPRDLAALSRSQLMALQQALNSRGFDSGPPDGSMGPATRSAVRAYQRSVGMPADGVPTLDLAQRLAE